MDALVSTGQGLLGNNMFAYCGNSSVVYIDPCGTVSQPAFSASCFDPYLTVRPDYIIFYWHPESTENLDEPAKKNHKQSECLFKSVDSFDALVNAISNVSAYVDDIFVYLHSDETNLSFYYAQYYSAEDIENSFNEIDITGNIYLFSCKGGRGELASTMATATNCTVIASIYKVSFGDGYARCGWENYFWDSSNHDPYSWHCFYPDGTSERFRAFFIYTK